MITNEFLGLGLMFTATTLEAAPAGFIAVKYDTFICFYCRSKVIRALAVFFYSAGALILHQTVLDSGSLPVSLDHQLLYAFLVVGLGLGLGFLILWVESIVFCLIFGTLNRLVKWYYTSVL